MARRCKKCNAKLSGTEKDTLDKDKGTMTLFCPGCGARHEFKRTVFGGWDLRKY